MASSKNIKQKEKRNERRMKEHLSSDVKKFQEIYDTQWPEAHDVLLPHLDSERETASILLEIVQRAYTFNKQIANDELYKAKIYAEQIVTHNEFIDEAPGQIGDGENFAEELKEYRYLQADKALLRTRKTFLETIFPQVLNKHKIDKNAIKELEEYAAKCMEATWYLCAEEPRVYMDLDDEQRTFDDNLFQTISKKGPKIDYILWPMLKQYKNGPVLVKGMVVCEP